MLNKDYEEKRKEFLRKFQQVMSPYGEMKACGRQKCSELILLARSIDPTYTYGDSFTGKLNIRQILALQRFLR